MVWFPSDRVEVLNEAVPLLRGIWVRAFAPSEKVTIPVGVGEPPVTVAVKEAFCPGIDGFGVELRVVVVATAWTF
jgi:hypothetical protein